MAVTHGKRLALRLNLHGPAEALAFVGGHRLGLLLDNPALRLFPAAMNDHSSG
jgi:hypothetical protein